MDEQENPYSAPTAASDQPQQFVDGTNLTPAGQGARFLNFLIDYLAQYAVAFAFGIVVVVIGGEDGAVWLESIPDLVFGLPILLGYYIVLESISSRTLGKIITGTKVVNEDGGKPTFGQILGRSFCRIIPFEAFSFFGTPPIGWHDRIPKTRVVKTR